MSRNYERKVWWWCLLRKITVRRVHIATSLLMKLCGFISSREWLESWCLFDVLAFKSFDGKREGITIASRPTPRHIYNCLQSIIDRAQENRNYRKEIQTKIKWNLIKKARRNHFREFIALHRVESALCASIFHESERINIEPQKIEIEKSAARGRGTWNAALIIPIQQD